MDFCNKCGAPLISVNSVLVCKRCNEKEYLNQLQIIEKIESLKREEKEKIESLKREEKEKIESLKREEKEKIEFLKRKEKEHTDFLERKEKDLTFPDAKDILVFRLKQPEDNIIKQRREKFGVLTNFSTMPFYKFLHKLCKEYNPTDFKWVKGDPCSSGSVENKYALLFIRNKLVKEIKKTIEEFILSDGKHYTLELLDKSTKDKIELIKSCLDRMKIKWDKKVGDCVKDESKKKDIKRKGYSLK